MKLSEAKQKFIDSWGTFGTKWGINRTMAAVHGLLLCEEQAISTDEVMEKLGISRGNANMNIRALIDWGLVKKVYQPGERMEFFIAEKDIYKVAILITRERRRRELEPIREILKEVKEVEDKTAEGKQFKKMVNEIDEFAGFADNILEKLTKTDRLWMLKTFKKIMS